MNLYKQIFWAIALLVGGVFSMWIFPQLPMSSLSAEPETASSDALRGEKSVNAPQDKKQISVSAEPIEYHNSPLIISSYGFVEPLFETEIVARVQGSIVSLSPNFVPGGFVQKGEVLVELDNVDYHAALIEAKAEQAKALADLEVEIARGKIAKSGISLESAKEPTGLSLRKPQRRQAQARADASQASVDRAKDNLERTKIRAPFDGLISLRSQGFGAYVGTGVTVGKVMSTDVATVRLPVSEADLKHLPKSGKGEPIGKGASTILQSDYLGNTFRWKAMIVRNEGVVDRKSRMVYLVAEVHDPYVLNDLGSTETHPLRFGTYVNAKIEGVTHAGLSIVSDNVIKNGRVPTISESGILKYTAVTVLRNEKGNAYIQGEFSGGDLLVTSVLPKFAEGKRVRVSESYPQSMDSVSRSDPLPKN